eukprot:1874446-Amphidinium_carterae.1
MREVEQREIGAGVWPTPRDSSVEPETPNITGQNDTTWRTKCGRKREVRWIPIASAEPGGVGIVQKPHLTTRVVWQHPSGRATAAKPHASMKSSFDFKKTPPTP